MRDMEKPQWHLLHLFSLYSQGLGRKAATCSCEQLLSYEGEVCLDVGLRGGLNDTSQIRSAPPMTDRQLIFAFVDCNN